MKQYKTYVFGCKRCRNAQELGSCVADVICKSVPVSRIYSGASFYLALPLKGCRANKHSRIHHLFYYVVWKSFKHIALKPEVWSHQPYLGLRIGKGWEQGEAAAKEADLLEMEFGWGQKSAWREPRCQFGLPGTMHWVLTSENLVIPPWLLWFEGRRGDRPGLSWKAGR